jgi:flagellar biosynthesis/type III secretory pathway M-ring protein FliF/YscJ
MRLEAQVKTAVQAKKTPVGAIIAIVAVVLVIAGGVIYKIKADHEKQLAAQQAERDQEREREKLRQAEQERKLELLEASFKKQIRGQERRRAPRHSEAAGRCSRQIPRWRVVGARPRPRPTRRIPDPRPVRPPLIKTKKAVSDDPLDGLKL